MLLKRIKLFKIYWNDLSTKSNIIKDDVIKMNRKEAYRYLSNTFTSKLPVLILHHE
jgi:hypothetical protein